MSHGDVYIQARLESVRKGVSCLCGRCGEMEACVRLEQRAWGW